MKPKEIFEVCHARYRMLRERQRGVHIPIVDWEQVQDGYRWRPGQAVGEDFLADFEMISARALSHRDWKGRRKLFLVYFIWGVEYNRAIALCGVAPGTFDYWMDEVKKSCGREFARAGLFPPFRYFSPLVKNIHKNRRR